MSVPASTTVPQQAPKAPRYLPNGMAVKEVEPHDDDGEFHSVEKIFGTRWTNGMRYYLVKFEGHDM